MLKDGGSQVTVCIDHVADSCPGCKGVEFGQQVLAGTTHTFRVTYVPTEYQGCDVEWKLQGSTECAEIISSDNKQATVKFTQATGEFSGVIVSATFDIPDHYAYDDYLVRVRDQVYVTEEQPLKFLNIGTTSQLTGNVTLFNAAHPQGTSISLASGMTWEVHPTPLNKNEDGLAVDGTGKVTVKAAGSYWVNSYASTGELTGQFHIMVPGGSIVTGQTVTVKPHEEAIYAFKAPASGIYKITGDMYIFYDASGNEVKGARDNGALKYNLSAGKTYYLSIYNGTADGTSAVVCINSTIQTYTVRFQANGGTKLSRSSVSVTGGSKISKMPTAGRKGYVLKGWYTKKTGGTKVTTSTVINKDQTLYAQWTKVSKPAKVKKPTLKNVKGKKMSVTYKKVTGAKGYQIVYSTNAKFKGAKKTTASALNKSIKGLKKGKTYYVKVRAYKLDSLNNKIYGSYSSVSKIKIKK